MVCTAEPSRVRRPPWEVLPSRRPIVQRPRADCEDDPEPGTRTSTLNPAHVRPERRALHNEPRLDDTITPILGATVLGVEAVHGRRLGDVEPLALGDTLGDVEENHVPE